MTPDRNDAKPTNIRWLVFILACGTSWLLYLHRYTWNIIEPHLKQEFHLSNTESGTIFSIFFVGYTAAQIPSGIIGDMFGVHFFLGIIIILWSLFMGGFGLGWNAFSLGLMRLGFGTAQAGAYPALGQVTRTWFPSSIRTVVQGLVASFSGRSGAACASIIMATFLMGWLEMTWRQALATLTAAGVVFGIAFLMLYRKSPEDDPRVNEAELELIREGEQTTGKPGILPFGRAFRNNTLRLLFSQQFLNAGADIAYTSFIGAYFAAQKVDIKAFGWLVAMPFIGGALGGAFGGIANDWLIPRLGRRWARSAIGFAGKFVAALTVFVLVQQTTPVAAGIWLLIVKFFSDWTQPTVWGTCTDVGGKFSATIFSINNTSGNAAAFVLPPLYGMLLDFYSTTHTVDGKTVRDTNFIPLFIVIAGMYLIVATAWLFIDCTKKLELTESQTPLETSEE